MDRANLEFILDVEPRYLAQDAAGLLSRRPERRLSSGSSG